MNTVDFQNLKIYQKFIERIVKQTRVSTRWQCSCQQTHSSKLSSRSSVGRHVLPFVHHFGVDWAEFPSSVECPKG